MKRIVVVLGMGRTGTSLVCQALARMGVSFGEKLLSPSDQNERGHFEHLPIKNAQIRMMDDLFGIRGWMFQETLPPFWYEHDDRVSLHEQRLLELLAAEVDRWPLFGFKDPLTARALSFWSRIFSKLELDPIWVACMRHPEAVYRSILRTGEAFPAHSEQARRGIVKIWAEYTVALRSVSATEIWYEDWASGDENARNLAEAVGWGGALPTVYEPELCHAGA
jgi:hypothetical protein